MSTERRFAVPSPCRRDTAGVALVVTLALLLLVTVTVVAFFSRTAANQQIASGSSQGAMATTFADGATQEIIGSLQKEMWDGSGQPTPAPSPSPAPILLPMTNVKAINPSRMVNPNIPSFPTDGTLPNPNAPYAQYANLVKQSYTGVATYSGGTATAPMLASTILTTAAAVGGKAHDGVYWNQPQLISISSTASTDLSNLVPCWIYTARDGTHPTAYDSNMAANANGTLSSTSVVGRYAYNIYDIGGLLNANVAGYGTSAPTKPDNGSADGMIFPGYKGSAMMADLSGLALGGNLSMNGASASSISSLPNKLSAYRYRQAGPTAFALLFGSGQYGGWLQPFLAQLDPGGPMGAPSGSNSLTSYGFTSRQDLIGWVNSQFPAPSSGGNSPAAWVLPYLTHFSYDTDAPTYTPISNRPQDTAAATAGGNDAAGLDPVINPGFNSPTTGTGLNVCDTNGYPLVKRRFPLSVLALFNNIYPGSPPANKDIADQIHYDFGLVWNSDLNCWDYQDWNGGTAIKKLSEIAAFTPTRSPNFFELLKAAITTGSLGKQWGESYDNDPNFVLGGPRGSSINFQILQIGANIISQSTTNYYPTDIHYTDNGNNVHFCGIKDLPYLYRSRIVHGIVADYASLAPAMGRMHNVGSNTPGYAKLAAIMLQPEIWNPHAPNALPLPGATYPPAFRVVAVTASPVPIRTLSAKISGIAWQKADGTSNANAFPTNIVYGNFTYGGGPDLSNQANYKGFSDANAYIQFSCTPPSTSTNALNTYREPVPLAAPGFPDSTVSSSPIAPTLTLNDGFWNGNPNTQVTISTSASTIPSIFSAPTSNKMMGFLMGYYCGGPGSTSGGATAGYVLSVSQVNPAGTAPGVTTALQLQYAIGTNFYPYDFMSCAIPTASTNGSYNAGNGGQQTEVGTRVDPRSQRWGNVWTRQSPSSNAGPYGTSSAQLYPGLTGAPSGDLTTNQGKLMDPPGPGWTLASYPPLGWLQINPGPGTIAYASGATNGAYYADPDGVYRPADAAYGASGNTTGLPEVMLSTNGSSAPASTASYDSRPVVLNRSFQSVAELGYVFRDTPWRSLDFINPQSGDSALLDVFCVYGPDPWSYAAQAYNASNVDPSGSVTTYLATTGLSAGRVNLNTRQVPVLAALLKSAYITIPTSNPTNPAALTDPQSTAVAESLVGWTTASDTANKGPLRNPAELVGKFVGGTSPSYIFSGFSSTLTGPLGGQGSSGATIKQQRECVMHALADSGTTRTWNLLIDLVAQTGQLSSSASTAGLGSFIVTGERHVWVSVAIDRATGKVIKIQTEPVRL